MVHENYENLHGAALGEVVNGQKTFISGGMNADYFTTGVRTSGKTGSKALAHLHSGISILLVPRQSDGLNTDAGMASQHDAAWSQGVSGKRTLVTFDEVKVPAENLLGREGDGFLAIMRNFNNERLALAITANRQARVCLEETARSSECVLRVLSLLARGIGATLLVYNER
ncbi:apdG [Symbiodinium natans]|uniref:ApdG protein n=1 Tax=Symbiodinium natans TaxID=878477 RepID=A0A812RCZ1_9DINO|nr:apdG [Symbiodinium natans]